MAPISIVPGTPLCGLLLRKKSDQTGTVEPPPTAYPTGVQSAGAAANGLSVLSSTSVELVDWAKPEIVLHSKRVVGQPTTVELVVANGA